jgi:hypothetical protein
MRIIGGDETCILVCSLLNKSQPTCFPFPLFQQFVSTRPISNYPTSFRKNEEIQKVYGNFHLFKMALSIIRLFTCE